MDRLDTQEFYEVCQQYRHAPDPVGDNGRLSASEAFEYLKGWIRGHIATCVARPRKVPLGPLTQERLKELVRYDEESGAFYWRNLAAGFHNPGDRADYVPRGHHYAQMKIDKRQYKAHRLVWLYVHGHWPRHSIDHVNGDPADNRLANLQDVPMTVNNRNRSKMRRGASGFRGVTLVGETFRAQISIDGKVKCIGRFATAEAAHAAYLGKRKEMFPDVRFAEDSHARPA